MQEVWCIAAGDKFERDANIRVQQVDDEMAGSDQLTGGQVLRATQPVHRQSSLQRRGSDGLKPQTHASKRNIGATVYRSSMCSLLADRVYRDSVLKHHADPPHGQAPAPASQLPTRGVESQYGSKYDSVPFF